MCLQLLADDADEKGSRCFFSFWDFFSFDCCLGSSLFLMISLLEVAYIGSLVDVWLCHSLLCVCSIKDEFLNKNSFLCH